jgi:hypothetical protein
LHANAREAGFSSKPSSPSARLRADHDDVLAAEPVLPGFSLMLTELFATA